MIIGVDFDNTIVCYDEVFHGIAVKNGLIPKSVPAVKDEIRNYLRKHNNEEAWIELQGIVYGPCILNAKPFKGVLDFLKHCKQHKIKVYIISHKTLHPFLGLRHNLHDYAHKWLEKQGFHDSKKIGLPRKNVFFELTKEEKLNRVIKQRCTHYIDDLPEFLAEERFPPEIIRILFDPNGKYKKKNNFECIKSWYDMIKKIK